MSSELLLNVIKPVACPDQPWSLYWLQTDLQLDHWLAGSRRTSWAVGNYCVDQRLGACHDRRAHRQTIPAYYDCRDSRHFRDYWLTKPRYGQVGCRSYPSDPEAIAETRPILLPRQITQVPVVPTWPHPFRDGSDYGSPDPHLELESHHLPRADAR